MSNHVLEYIIKATDKTGSIIASAIEGVKRYAATVKASMAQVKKDLNTTDVEERFIHTTAVLDKVGLALDRLGVSGEQFNDVYDTLKRRLDDFNRTGEGADALMEHFRLSMEDVGMSAKQVNAGLEMLKSNIVKADKAGADLGANMGKGFRIAHLAAGALNGNVYSLTRAISMATRQVKAFQLSAASLTVIGAVVMGLVMVGQKLYEMWKSHREEMERIKQLRLEETLKNIADVQAEVTREITRGNSALGEEERHNNEIINQRREQLKIENELARVQELRTAKTEEERRAVNAIHDAYNREIDREAEFARLELSRGTNDEKIKKYGVAIGKLREAASGMDAPQDEANRRLKELEAKGLASIDRDKVVYTGGYASTWGWVDLSHKEKKTQGEIDDEFRDWKLTNEEYKKAKEVADQLDERRKSINEQIEKLEEDRSRLETQNRELEGKAEVEYNKGVLEEYRAFEQAQEQYETDLNEALRQKALERIAIMQAQLDEQKRMAAEQVAIAEGAEQDALARLHTAQARSSEAWGFYKDRDALNSHNASVDADIAAKKQYVKDLRRIETGRDADRYSALKHIADKGGMEAVEEQLAEWRRKKSLSVDSEATMRVALANREQAAAQDYAQLTAEATQEARDYLERISNALVEGGEE